MPKFDHNVTFEKYVYPEVLRLYPGADIPWLKGKVEDMWKNLNESDAVKLKECERFCENYALNKQIPKGWKCSRTGCKVDYKHGHSSFFSIK